MPAGVAPDRPWLSWSITPEVCAMNSGSLAAGDTWPEPAPPQPTSPAATSAAPAACTLRASLGCTQTMTPNVGCGHDQRKHPDEPGHDRARALCRRCTEDRRELREALARRLLRRRRL